MKSLKLLRIPGVLLGFGAFVFLAPSSRAQQEIDPQNFDQVEASPAPAKAKNPPRAMKTIAAHPAGQPSETTGKATLRPAAERKPQNAQQLEAVAVPAKRKSKNRERDNN